MWPADDDDVMPPSGKDPLTAEEIVTLIRWIQSGAPFPEKRAMAAVGVTR